MTNTSEERDAVTEMNTGVSDTDIPSPQQADGTYLTGEPTEPFETVETVETSRTIPVERDDVDTEMNTGVSDTDIPSPQQAEGTYLTGE